MSSSAAIPEYVELCKDKCFLASKAVTGYKELERISIIKTKLEIHHGAKMGAGTSKEHLEPNGFNDSQPLGAASIITNEDLSLHHDNLGHKRWLEAYAEYAASTKYGVLIFAGTPENFQVWAKSEACLDEVKQIPTGRLFAYIEHTEDDEGGRQGYIVHIDAQNGKGAATVANGKGYVIFANGSYYHGELKGGNRNGYGTNNYGSGDKYVGDWKDGNMNGHGTYTYGSGRFEGDKYVGDWKDGKKNGHGTYTYASGSKYVGDYKDGKMNGHGTYTYADGEKYVGDWKDDNMKGHGTYTFANGDKYEGKYQNDEQHGHGTYTFANGDKYKKEYNNGEEVSSERI